MNDTTTAAARGLATDETDRLISSDKVEGTPVYNPKGERLGKVHHLMIDKYTGQVAYAVMSFGGFLGIGEKYQAARLGIRLWNRKSSMAFSSSGLSMI